MEKHSDVERILISREQLQKRIIELGKQISKDYEGKKPIVVSILKGSWIFLADLVREIDIDIECEFMVVSSYGASTSTSGHVTISKDLTVNIENRDIIIVEDIIDSGTTLDFIKKLFKSRKANSIEICSLLSKPSRRKIDIDVKYIGFEIPDLFVIGYGLDFDEKYRSLKDIGILKPEAYNGKI